MCIQHKPEATKTPSVTEWRKNLGRNQAQFCSDQTKQQFNSSCSRVRLCRGLIWFPWSCPDGLLGDKVFTRLVCVISATVVQILFGQKLGHTPCLTVDTLYCSNSISSLSVSLLFLRSEPSWLKLISTLLHNFKLSCIQEDDY